MTTPFLALLRGKYASMSRQHLRIVELVTTGRKFWESIHCCTYLHIAGLRALFVLLTWVEQLLVPSCHVVLINFDWTFSNLLQLIVTFIAYVVLIFVIVIIMTYLFSHCPCSEAGQIAWVSHLRLWGVNLTLVQSWVDVDNSTIVGSLSV